ncbi:MAG: AraC family transcriptional regulator [Gammaproteobacteria bacterium]|nr:AraC family transcriptional regulator [Gammaproteobacteria bacterium]
MKAAFHAQFKAAMNCRGIDSDLYFRKFNLPTEVTDPEGLLPLKPFFHLVNVVAISENMPDFGSFVAQTTPWHRILSLGPLIEQSENLKSLLQTFCDIASDQSSLVNFTLVDQGSHFDFCYVDEPLYKDDIQMELYRITSMIQLVHLATGPDWIPASIRLNIPKSSVVKVCPMLAKSDIHFSQADSAFPIPCELLLLPVRVDAPKVENHHKVNHPDSSAEITNAIRQIINTYARATHVEIEDVAKLTDTSVRTLQRRLQKNGLGFNNLLSQAKFEHAKEMLIDTKLSIRVISESLGYSDPAHFTRAFRRWAGVTPSKYRARSISRLKNLSEV